MPSKLNLSRLTLVLVTLSLSVPATVAQRETVFHNFGAQKDGEIPYACVTFDSKGNMFGTTVGGGPAGYGTIFKLTPGKKESVLYSFTGGSDGGYPYAGVTLDAKGNIYGAATVGGARNAGTIFKITPTGKMTVLHSFTGYDGGFPYGTLVFDKKGILYGTTAVGGNNGVGTVFKITTSGKMAILYSFLGGTDGANPHAGLVFDKHGNLYGTTLKGGGPQWGTVFMLTPAGQETVLYTFLGGTDGASPYSGVTVDANGNVDGTTLVGGNGNGVVYSVGPSGNETVLYTFTGGVDGSGPWGGLVFDKHGNLYGTAWGGGDAGNGVVFKLDPSGNETVLHSFVGPPDGANPQSGLTFDSKKSNLYGTTFSGGIYLNGTVFKVTP